MLGKLARAQIAARRSVARAVGFGWTLLLLLPFVTSSATARTLAEAQREASFAAHENALAAAIFERVRSELPCANGDARALVVVTQPDGPRYDAYDAFEIRMEYFEETFRDILSDASQGSQNSTSQPNWKTGRYWSGAGIHAAERHSSFDTSTARRADDVANFALVDAVIAAAKSEGFACPVWAPELAPLPLDVRSNPVFYQLSRVQDLRDRVVAFNADSERDNAASALVRNFDAYLDGLGDDAEGATLSDIARESIDAERLKAGSEELLLGEQGKPSPSPAASTVATFALLDGATGKVLSAGIVAAP